MKKATVTFIVLLALLLAVPWLSYAGHGHNGGTRVFVGGSFWFGPPPYWGPAAWAPPYVYGPAAFYGPPPVIIQQPPVFVQRGPAESDYWYYCDNPQGFYPYIKSCPGGWMKVVPETVPPNR